jgi:hypothetical protein
MDLFMEEADINNSSNSNSQIQSFYEYPTMLMDLDESVVSLNSTVIEQPSVVLQCETKPPTWNQVEDSLQEHGLYEQRTSEVKKYGVTFSKKSDADSSSGKTTNL